MVKHVCTLYNSHINSCIKIVIFLIISLLSLNVKKYESITYIILHNILLVFYAIIDGIHTATIIAHPPYTHIFSFKYVRR